MRDVSGVDLRDDPAALRVVSKAVPVDVVFAETDGVLETLEGPVAYRAGDALLTGPARERWPVGRARFDAVYAPVAPTPAGRAGRYAKRPTPSLARRMDAPFTTTVGARGDALRGGPGDWLVQHDDGTTGIVQQAIFPDRYELER